jgi:hypothetical protein
MTEDQRQQWKRALADRARASRTRRYRPRRGKYSVAGAGMVRIPPAQANRRTAP